MRIPNRDGRRRPIVGLLFGIWTIAVFAACSSGSSAAAPLAGAAGGSTTRDSANLPAASAAPAPAGAQSGSGSGSNVVGGNGNEVALVSDAKIVRTGSLELEVADVARAVSGGRDAIRALGGYIGASQQQQSGDQTIATVTYRIPAAR